MLDDERVYGLYTIMRTSFHQHGANTPKVNRGPVVRTCSWHPGYYILGYPAGLSARSVLDLRGQALMIRP